MKTTDFSPCATVRRHRTLHRVGSRHSALRTIESLEQRLVFAAAPVLGMNLDTVVDYSAAWTFTDAFKASRDWFTLSYNTATNSESWSGGGTPVIDNKGWPVELQSWTNEQGQPIQQRLATLMYREINGNYPSGKYHAQWKGTGTVTFSYDARVTASGTLPDGTHWADVNVNPTNEGILMKITDMPPVVDPTGVNPPTVDPIRDVHMWVPDYNGQSFKGQVWEPGASFSPFHPLFTERLQSFKALRFMDWLKTNVSTNEHWADRRGWDEANQTGSDGKGVALEYMVALANEINADVWLNMPYHADDDFVRNLATFTRDNLEPGLKANVEWSNEIWNYAAGFETFGWITEQLALPENTGKTRYQFAAQEIKRDFDIWSDVFSATPDRLVRIVAGQAANPTGVTKAMLENMEGKYDAVSCTGYFGLSSSQRSTFNSSTTAEEIAKAAMGAVPSAIRALKEHRTLGQQYAAAGKTIKIYAYEAGQHADGQGNANLSYLPALYAAQTHPMMYEAYDDFVRGFYDMGGDLAMHYTYVSRNDRNGSWGALQSQNQPISGAPKYRSLVEGTTGAAYVPEYTIATESANGAELGTTPVSFRITRSGDKSLAQAVSFQLGGAGGGGDYVNPGATINFAAGQVSALLTIVPINDTTVEDTETVTVTLLNGSGYKVDGVSTRITASANITDDDGYVHVTLPIVNPGFENGDLTGWTKFQVGSGTNRIDVAPPSPGTTVASAPSAPYQGAKYAWGAGPVGNLTGAPVYTGIYQRFSLSSHAAGIDAGSGKLVFTGYGAGWAGDFAQLEVRYLDAAGVQIGSTLTSNKATADKAWTKMTSDTTVPALTRTAELRATFNRVTGNANDAGVDQLAAQFTYPVVPTVDLAVTDANASEPGTNKATFTVTRSGNISLVNPFTVHYAVSGTATNGTDFTNLTGSVVIPAGSATATITVTPTDDILDEPDETVKLTLVGKAQYVSGTSTTGTATIVDNDLPRVMVSAVDADAAEAGEDPATFVVERLSEVIGQPLTVRYTLGGTATNGSDYQSLTGVVTIPANETVATVTVTPINDTTVERDETVVFNLSSNSAYTVATPSSATATIVNDDFPKVTVTATDANGSEVGPNPVTFTFTRTGEQLSDDLAVSFETSGTAAAGEDYTLAAQGVTIPAGALSASVTITPVADNEVEGDETLIVTLLPNTGYTPGVPSSATATIADGPPISPLPSWVSSNSVATWNASTKTLNITGATTITADPGSAAPIITASGSAAVVTINPGSSLQIQIGSLNLSNGATAIVSSMGAARSATNHRVLVIDSASFSIDATSKLDLMDNDLLLKNATLATAQSLITRGFNNGNWGGKGITSSAAANDIEGTTSLGAVSNAELAAASFGAATGLDSDDILVKYTYYGDADLSGHVTLDDFNQFLNGYQNPVPDTWLNGDFDHSGNVTLDDFNMFLFNYQNTRAPI